MTELHTQPLFIILNAGSGDTETAVQRDIIERELASAGRSFELTVIEEPGQLAQAARNTVEKARQAGGTVVAAGGDGTINSVAAATLSSGCPFGVLPQGTFNYFGRTYGIPEDLAEAVRALLTARLQPVQVGRLNDRIFLVNASIGLYPTLLEQRERHQRRFWRGRFISLLSAIATLFGFQKRLVIGLDLNGAPEVIRTTTLFVGNNALQLEQVGFDPAKLGVEDGRLVAIAPKTVGRLAMLGLLLRGALGKLGQAEDVVALSFKRMTVRPGAWYRRRTVKVAIDGEVMRLTPPLQFEVIEDQLLLLVPA